MPPRCHALGILDTDHTTPENPWAGEGFAYLGTGVSQAGDGTPASGSDGGERNLLGRCSPVLRQHRLDRVTYGWDEWIDGRLEALGWEGFLDEQLHPAAID